MRKILSYFWSSLLIILGLLGFGVCIISIIYPYWINFVNTPLSIVFVGYLSVIIFFVGIRNIYFKVMSHKVN